MKTIVSGAAAGLLLLAGAAASAQQTSGQVQTTVSGQTASGQPGGIAFAGRKCHGPINVSSDSFEGDLNTKVGIYTGNVIMIQSECRLRADKVVAEATTGNDLNRMTATGNVVFASSSGTATGDIGVYDLGPKTVTLTGKVILTKGKDVMRGTRLVVNMDTGLAHLTAKGAAGGGRVQSVFVPKSDTAGDPSKPKPPAAN